MNPSDLRGSLELYMKRNPIASYYAKWAALYLAIALITVFAILHLISMNQRVRAEIAAIQTRLSAMPEANLTAEQRDALMKNIQSNAQLESTQFLTASDIPTVLSIVSAEASSHAVTLKKINTLASEAITGYEYVRMPITLEVEGEYQKVGDFLNAIKQKLSWDFTWEKVRMSVAPGPQTGKVQSELRLAFYSRKS